MKIAEMKSICDRCSHSGELRYPNGKIGICCTAIDLQDPMDIMTLSACPLGKSYDKLRDISRVEMLNIFGILYAKIIGGPEKLSLQAEFSRASRPISSRKQTIAKALLAMECVSVYSEHGKHRWYQWSGRCPSLDMVERICDKMMEIMQEKSVKTLADQKAKLLNEQVKITATKGATSCSYCPLSRVHNCRELVKRLGGMDCKQIKLNTIRVHNG